MIPMTANKINNCTRPVRLRRIVMQTLLFNKVLFLSITWYDLVYIIYNFKKKKLCNLIYLMGHYLQFFHLYFFNNSNKSLQLLRQPRTIQVQGIQFSLTLPKYRSVNYDLTLLNKLENRVDMKISITQIIMRVLLYWIIPSHL